MTLLLDILYLVLLLALSPWLAYAALRHGKYREGYAAKLLGSVPRRHGNAPCIWLHAVSVGEVNLLQTVLDRIEHDLPEWECAISTTTKTGYDLARRRYAPRHVFYCPLDFSWAVRRAMRRIRPDMLVLAELELWPNLIHAARRSGARVAIINGRLSESSWKGYSRIRPLVARVLRKMNLIAVQNEEYADRFRQLGAPPESVQVTGSLKFDGAETDRDHPFARKLANLAGISRDDVVFLAGSTQEPEEALALETWTQLQQDHPRLRLILAPRHPTRCNEVSQLLDQSGVHWQRRSRLEQEGHNAHARVLLVDTVGELGAWWGSAQIAFVGGSMGQRGGQNMIEPSAYGAAVCFGPKTRNFRDVVGMLLQHDAAQVVADGGELTDFVRRCLDDPAWAQALGNRARQLVVKQRGATQRTLSLLASVLGVEQPPEPPLPVSSTAHPHVNARPRTRNAPTTKEPS